MLLDYSRRKTPVSFHVERGICFSNMHWFTYFLLENHYVLELNFCCCNGGPVLKLILSSSTGNNKVKHNVFSKSKRTFLSASIQKAQFKIHCGHSRSVDSPVACGSVEKRMCLFIMYINRSVSEVLSPRWRFCCLSANIAKMRNKKFLLM